MNKNISYLVAGSLLVLVSLWIFKGESSVTNYPSDGKDIIAFGDSLIVGVGATTQNSFISLLSKKLGKPIVNLGVSGNTTKDGLNRIKELDKYNPKVVILLLGGNDYLQKVPIDETFQNLEKIIQNIHARGGSVLLLGVRGGLLSDRFDSKFEELSRKHETAYVSNVLDGLLGKSEYMSDMIHPNDLGYKKISDKVYPALAEMLK